MCLGMRLFTVMVLQCTTVHTLMVAVDDNVKMCSSVHSMYCSVFTLGWWLVTTMKPQRPPSRLTATQRGGIPPLIIWSSMRIPHIYSYTHNHIIMSIFLIWSDQLMGTLPFICSCSFLYIFCSCLPSRWCHMRNKTSSLLAYIPQKQKLSHNMW